MLTLNLFKLMQTKPDYYQIDSKIKVLEIISNLYKNDFAITNKSSKSRTIKSQNDIKTIISYIKDHYNSKISLDQLASISSMSKYHLCHVFKEKTGSSISNYHQNYRLKVATDLLTNTTMNINQISRKIGYNSPSYFVKKFKETYNLSPNRYRKKHI